ncbi:MAG: autotransporter domain-containing protein [Burkholderiaceae bacterium]
MKSAALTPATPSFNPHTSPVLSGPTLSPATSRRSCPGIWRPVALAVFMLPLGSAMAGSGTCTGSGTISVSDPRVGTCILETGDSLDVSATGSIDGSLNGVLVDVGQAAGTISNSGRITAATFDGVHNEGSITQIVNTGTISGPGAGVYNAGTIGTLTNNAGATVSSSGATPSSTTWGTLTTINNSGLIDGAVVTSNTAINLSGSSARVTGAITNTNGSVAVQTGASFTTENTISAATVTVGGGAVLRVGATAHVLTATDAGAGAFSNSGTVHVPDGVIGQVSGNYTQSGTLRVGASSASSYGRLVVTGDAALTADAGFDVDVNSVNTLANGDTLSGVLAATGTLTNAAATDNVTDNSALFSFRSVTNGNQVDLAVQAVGSADEGEAEETPATAAPAPAAPTQGIVPAVIGAGLLNGVPAARVLDGYIRGGRTGTDWDAVVSALGRLPDNASVARAVGQAMPSMHGNAGQALLGHTGGTGAALGEQLGSVDQSGGGHLPGLGLWVKPLGTWVDQDAVDQVSGYRVRTTGLVGGVQRDIGPGKLLGVGLAYLDGRIDGRDFALGHRSDVESVQLIGYGAYNLGAWRLKWQADATRSSVKTLRQLGFIGRTAVGSYHGNTWHLGLNVGRPMDMAGATVTPSVGIDWRRLRSNAYTESGAGALDLQMGAQKAEELLLKVGVDSTHPVSEHTRLLGHAAIGYDLASGKSTIQAQFAGGGAVFVTEGLPRQRALVELGFGVKHSPSDALDMSMRYDLLLREGMTDQGVSLRVDWRF